MGSLKAAKAMRKAVADNVATIVLQEYPRLAEYMNNTPDPAEYVLSAALAELCHAANAAVYRRQDSEQMESRIISAIKAAADAEAKRIAAEDAFGKLEPCLCGDIPGSDEDFWQEICRTNRKRLHTAIGRLSPRTRLVVELRFGLNDGKARTSKEVGNLIDRTPARVQQITEAGLRELKELLNDRLLM